MPIFATNSIIRQTTRLLMIFVKGYGQMCNNILQYAHAYAFGREYGIKVVSMRFAYKYRYFAL